MENVHIKLIVDIQCTCTYCDSKTQSPLTDGSMKNVQKSIINVNKQVVQYN